MLFLDGGANIGGGGGGSSCLGGGSCGRGGDGGGGGGTGRASMEKFGNLSDIRGGGMEA